MMHALSRCWRNRLTGIIGLGVVMALVVTVGCSEEQPAAQAPRKISAATTTSAMFLVPVPQQAVLPNARHVTDKVISGGQPEGDAGFEALKAMGIKTIVSVDGSTPDVARAHRFGMRYVHLPIRYSGVTPDQARTIAKALEELPGPIYIHCHHGKHRSAAAVAVACVVNGSLPSDKALSVLQTFGTGANYKGLWAAAREARPVPQDELKEMNVQYVEAKKVGALAEAMVLIDERFDHLKVIQKAGWQMPRDNPDLDPPNEALQLQELLHEVGRSGAAATRPVSFSRLLMQGDDAAKSLETALAINPPDRAKAEAAFVQVGNSCAACHKAYRD